MYYDEENIYGKRGRISSIFEDIVHVVPRRYCRLRRHLHGRYSNHKRKTERIVFKSGHFNFAKPTSKYHVFPDIVTTFTQARWRYTLLYCFLTYILTWLIFSIVWLFILYLHGDFEEENLPHVITSTEWTPCVREIYDFTSVFLFSIEIHTTIGYGTRSLTLECPAAILTMCLECILGTFTQSFVVGVVFAKLTRPKSRAHTLIFSQNAIINQRDRNLCLIFRVGNIRKSRIIAVRVHAYLIRYVMVNRDVLNYEQIKLDLTPDACADTFSLFPISAVHKIDARSPFYAMSAYDLLRSSIEILVVIEGTIESTGQPVQARSSYSSHEILWGHHYQELVGYTKARQGYVIDFSKFDVTRRVNTPLCSAKDLDVFYGRT